MKEHEEMIGEIIDAQLRETLKNAVVEAFIAKRNGKNGEATVDGITITLPEQLSTVPRPHCEHDPQTTGYSYVAPSRDPYDRPDTVFLRCRKCGAEWMEDFQ